MTNKKEEKTKLKPLNTDMNAMRWAEEFVKIHGGDKELMHGWFANAIMCGWDNRKYHITFEHEQL